MTMHFHNAGTEENCPEFDQLSKEVRGSLVYFLNQVESKKRCAKTSLNTEIFPIMSS